MNLQEKMQVGVALPVDGIKTREIGLTEEHVMNTMLRKLMAVQTEVLYMVVSRVNWKNL